MHKTLLITVAGAILGIGLTAYAEEQIDEVWQCKLNDGKTLEEVQTNNSIWVKAMHDNVSDDISSMVVTSVVGDTGHFLFVDSFPDLATWAAAKAWLETEEGQALDAQFQALANCESNRLYRSTTS